MATLNEIETKARSYSVAREALAGVLMALKDEQRAVNRKYMPRIKKLIEAGNEHRADLAAAIEASPELFVKPRSVIFHGIKCGFMKSKGRIEWDDEAAVIARIRKLLPEAQAELLIRVKEAVHKSAVYDLTAADLKRLGIRVEDDGDAVLIKEVAGDLEKLLDAFLKESQADSGSGA